jgi:hypothetical protein
MGPQVDPLAIVATVLGVLSLITCVCCGIFGIPLPIAAAICGGISLSRQRNDPDRFSSSSKPLAIVGLVIGIISLILTVVSLIIGVGGQLLQNANI